MPEEVTSSTSETAKPAAPNATIAALGQHEGQSITLHGWLYNSRESGKLLFPIFRDGTGTVQGVAHVKSAPPAAMSSMSKTSKSCSAFPSPIRIQSP
jgi:asparaginyl-tRNA synthetase